MSIDYTDLESWFAERPLWLRDAARRLFQTGDVTEADLVELSILCKREAGIAVPDLPDLIAVPIAGTALRITGSGTALRLDSLSDVMGINALAPRNPLLFGAQNLTIVFGSNGSGKSGYIRILKHVCGGRGLRTLHRNVFDSTNPEQCCKVTYTQGTASKTLDWKPDDGTHPDLSSISLFDSDCANVYINDENQVAYEPTLLCYFRRLAEVCDQLASSFKNEIAAKISAKPALPPDCAPTTGGRWYVSLTHRTTDAAVDEHCTWTPALESELAGLVQRLSEANPAEKAKTLRKLKTHVQDLLTLLQQLKASLTDDALQQLLAARVDVRIKRRAADDDAKAVFENAPLKGVASESWQNLWEKARFYSESVAYPEKTFPVVEEGARCVLCQQELKSDATTRMTSFEAFIKGTLESDAKAAEGVLQLKITSLKEPPLDADLNAKLDVAGIANDTLRASIRTRCQNLKSRRDTMLSANSSADVPPLPASTIEQSLADIAAAHETAAVTFDEDAKQDNKAELTEKVRNLRAQKWLSEQKAAVQTEIVRLQEIALLEAAQRLTSTNRLSTKKSDLSEQLITADFVKRFEEELKNLGAAHLKVTIEKTRTTKGQVWHRISLKDNTQPIMTREVLSEGELRVVSIAAFLADVAINQDNAAFIFDDPISSLDQEYEERAAYRLATMSKTRQVVVFTHRLSLLHLLEEACKKESVSCTPVSLQRQPWGAGEPSELPLAAKNPAKALNALISERLAKAKKAWQDEGNDAYQIYAKSLCSDLRIVIERLIEIELLADVVQRFRRPINTMGKINKLAKISAEDCKLFDELMTKYSRYEHAQPDEAPVSLPEPDELEADLKRLKKWLDSFSVRAAPAPV